MRPFDYYRPESFEEAFHLLALPDKTVIPMAGATDLLPGVRDEAFAPDVVVDVKGLPGLRDLKVLEDGALFVGAAVRMNELVHSELVGRHWAVLAEGAGWMGNEQVRNRATIGGNCCTASPAADTPPALLVLEASAVIKTIQGDRRVPMTEFFTGPKRTVLQTGELLAGFEIPQPPLGTVARYVKLSRRKKGDLTIVGVAALAYPQDGGYAWRLALGAVAPTPVRAPKAEALLTKGHAAERIEQAASAAYSFCSPISDIRASAEYRTAMVIAMTKRAIQGVLEQLEAA
ncbi:MAG: xanthine dehydrogenase family protein subunit M [Anaerolineae bacterium]|nr:xanthine dehydrogenase family protein subunit M [Anaerolineae bacterium]